MTRANPARSALPACHTSVEATSHVAIVVTTNRFKRRVEVIGNRHTLRMLVDVVFVGKHRTGGSVLTEFDVLKRLLFGVEIFLLSTSACAIKCSMRCYHVVPIHQRALGTWRALCAVRVAHMR
jgi:hypothetical protein